MFQGSNAQRANAARDDALRRAPRRLSCPGQLKLTSDERLPRQPRVMYQTRNSQLYSLQAYRVRWPFRVVVPEEPGLVQVNRFSQRWRSAAPKKGSYPAYPRPHSSQAPLPRVVSESGTVLSSARVLVPPDPSLAPLPPYRHPRPHLQTDTRRAQIQRSREHHRNTSK